MKKLIWCVILISLLLTGCWMNSLYYNESKISSDTNSFNLNKAEQTIENQKYVGVIEFEGMDTIWTYDTEENKDIEISYLLSVSKGKAKLVLIDPKNNVKVLAENFDNTIQNEMETIQLSLEKGKNRIKLVAADKAQIHLELGINEGNLHKVGF